VLYGSSTDSRWHECGHGTAFRTRWMNDVIYQVASFMVLREPTVWRWSHTRHHTDTIIVGRDPEIAVMRPPKFHDVLLSFIGISQAKTYIKKIAIHATGRLLPDEATFIPEAERPDALPELDQPRFPIRLDLSDYALWISGNDVWDPSGDRQQPKAKAHKGEQATIECFLADLMTHESGGITADAKTVRSMIGRFCRLRIRPAGRSAFSRIVRHATDVSFASAGRTTSRPGIARSAARCSIGWCVGPSSPSPIESCVHT